MDLDTILGLLFFVFFVVVPLFSRGARGKQGRPGQGRTKGGGRASTPGSGAATAGRPSASTGQDAPSVTLAEIRRRVEEAQRREQERARMAGQPVTPPQAATRPGSLVGSDPFEGALVSVPERRLSDIGERRPAGLGPEGAPGQEGKAPARAASAREGAPAGMGDRHVIGREGSARGAQLDTGSLIGREGTGGQGTLGSRPTRAGVLGREGSGKVVSPTVAPTTRAARRSARTARAEIGSEVPARDGKRPVAAGVAARLGGAAALQTDRAGILQGLIWHEILSPPLALRRRRER